MNITIENWGIIPYSSSWRLQREYFDELIAAKLGGKPYQHHLIFCQHPSVYTLGRSGQAGNMLLSSSQLSQIGAELYHIDRGGDITYHGPGQIVCYPILDLEEFGLGLKEYIHLIEEAVIKLCADYGIEATRIEKATGVWLTPAGQKPRKICAIGVRSSHYVTMHGLALNVNTDLKYFEYINPCGFVDKGVTSMQKELNREMDMEEVTQKLQHYIINLLKRKTE